jgi:type IV pilus assembly protein PilM
MRRRVRAPIVRWLSTPWPQVAVEFAARRVSVVAISGTRTPAVTAYASEAIPDGALVPALNAPNVHDRAAVGAALARAFARANLQPRRVGVVLPDTVARVSLVRFEAVPPRAEDLDALVRWQVRKAAPFRLEEAQVAYTPGAAHGTGREFVVTLARRDVVAEYEEVCAAAGAHAGLVDLATFSVINAVLLSQRPASPGDWLLVHCTPDYSTLAIIRGTDLIFYRNRPHEGDESLADLVHQTAMYHEDRLGGGGIPRVLLAGVAASGAERAEAIARQVGERLGAAVEPVDPRGAVALRDRIAAPQTWLDDLAPAVGLLLRGRAA